ncbi:ATP-binding protein [Paenibacillus sp. CECT 9249]|uniref:ATP-binding protein n=1 Tax=unclassified Paenibacillus TaxID=185978 RepID=UPI001C1118F9|nr:ATP-binding protein [Paenibacillus sp. CECT 9249]MBU5444101.1 cell wall metabolism sensor histidine kinase WalK [Paenibacillus sp. MSJ-34]CAH0118708.1 Sensor histidine kinase ResE [Paenibacillus sp. CECT 9249]
MSFWRSVVGKLWMTIIGLVAFVLLIVGVYLLNYIDFHYSNAPGIKKMFIYTGISGFLLTTFFAFFLFYKITQPLRSIKKAADLIRNGNYEAHVATRSTDEIGELAKTFNHMAGELKITIQDLNHEKEHLSSVLRSMTDAVITFDAEGQMISANPPGEAILQTWNVIDWHESQENDVRKPAMQVPEPMYALFRTVLEQGRDISTKVHVKQEVWSVSLAPLHSLNAVRGVVAVLRNVTEEVRMEKLRKDFLANVSHEIRTPLSMLQGYSEALLDDIAATPEERREMVQVIYDESLRMGRLVKDLLDLARMEAGHMEMKHDKVDVEQLLTRVYRKFTVLAKERDIMLHYDRRAEDLTLMAADEDRLEQVLTNLLDNAFRHTSGGVQIRMTADRETTSSGPVIVLKVSDEGQGIPSEDLPFIFERFYKADKARKRELSGGTGLGLAIVRNIVEAHNGTISVDSTVGKGTTFTVKLPVEKQG